MSNPYQSPDPESKDPAGMDPPSSLPGKVRLLAILMLVQAGLQLAMGIAVIVMLFFVPQIFGKQLELQQNIQRKMAEDQGIPQPKLPDMVFIMQVTYASQAAAALLPIPLMILAGIRNLKYRGRTFGIIAVSSSLLSIGTCYCAPTAIGLFVFGLVVYLDEKVKQGFLATEEAIETGRPPGIDSQV